MGIFELSHRSPLGIILHGFSSIFTVDVDYPEPSNRQFYFILVFMLSNRQEESVIWRATMLILQDSVGTTFKIEILQLCGSTACDFVLLSENIKGRLLDWRILWNFRNCSRVIVLDPVFDRLINLHYLLIFLWEFHEYFLKAIWKILKTKKMWKMKKTTKQVPKVIQGQPFYEPQNWSSLLEGELEKGETIIYYSYPFCFLIHNILPIFLILLLC